MIERWASLRQNALRPRNLLLLSVGKMVVMAIVELASIAIRAIATKASWRMVREATLFGAFGIGAAYEPVVIECGLGARFSSSLFPPLLFSRADEVIE